jgi:protein-tyrosine-phosphatase
MVSFEEAGKMLDEAAEALPEEIFKSLNGGVNLLPDTRESGDGRYTMGLYHNDVMGRRVEIFYGSFVRLYGDIPPEEFRAHLVSTLHHELTHHIEGLAGDRTLERWDEEQTAQWLAGGEPITADSILFVDADDCALAPAAAALFALAARSDCPEVRCASAGMTAGAAMLPEAVKAAANLGADLSGHVPAAVSAETLAAFDAVLCMTLSQADALAERFPDYDSKIMCLGETDIHLPKHKALWGAVMRRLRAEADALIDELCMEDE